MATSSSGFRLVSGDKIGRVHTGLGITELCLTPRKLSEPPLPTAAPILNKQVASLRSAQAFAYSYSGHYMDRSTGLHYIGLLTVPPILAPLELGLFLVHGLADGVNVIGGLRNCPFHRILHQSRIFYDVTTLQAQCRLGPAYVAHFDPGPMLRACYVLRIRSTPYHG